MALERVADFLQSDNTVLELYDLSKSQRRAVHVYLSTYREIEHKSEDTARGRTMTITKNQPRKFLARPTERFHATIMKPSYTSCAKKNLRYKFLRILLDKEKYYMDNSPKKRQCNLGLAREIRKAITGLGVCTTCIADERQLNEVKGVAKNTIRMLTYHKTKSAIVAAPTDKKFVDAASACLVVLKKDGGQMPKQTILEHANLLCEEDCLSAQSLVGSTLDQLASKTYGQLVKRTKTEEMIDLESSPVRDTPPKSLYAHNNDKGVVLVVDEREGGGSLSQLHKTCKTLQRHGTSYETASMPAGDYGFVYKCAEDKTYKLPYLIERKEIKDLAASITDGRYVKQKARMVALKTERPHMQLYYLVEGDPNQYEALLLTYDVSLQKIKQILKALDNESDFIVLRTKDIHESISLLHNFWNKVSQNISLLEGAEIPEGKKKAERFIDETLNQIEMLKVSPRVDYSINHSSDSLLKKKQVNKRKRTTLNYDVQRTGFTPKKKQKINREILDDDEVQIITTTQCPFCSKKIKGTNMELNIHANACLESMGS